jgi:ABC-type polysaccharide/polyol phosphate transport system ATPase subunit
MRVAMVADQMTAVEQIVPPAPDAAIQVGGVGKMYRIYDRPQDRLKQMLWRGRRQYGREFWALRDISFEVRRGETVGIIGRNGSGKSTLLQIIAGTLAPSEGEVRVSGRVAALLELGSGFNPEFTGRENVFLNGSILGIGRAEMEQRFDEIAAFADIGEFIEQPVKLYSSGMFVRLAFAVQACLEPDVLIVDEALAVGDVFFTQKCFRRMAELIDRGTAVVLVTHDVATVSQFCQQVMVLNQGHDLFYGNPVTAIRKYLALQRGDVSAMRQRARKVSAVLDDHGDAAAANATQFEWPGDDAFLDLSHIAQDGSGQAELTALAVCDMNGEPCQVFQIGDTAVFYYQFHILEDIDAPLGGISIVNPKNVIVHGKNSLQHRLNVPRRVTRGTVLRFRQQITLDITPDEYTFNIGLACISGGYYEQADQLAYAALAELTTRVLSVGEAGSFSVTLRRQGQQLPHHGLSNLPGECALMLLSGTDDRNGQV